MMMSRHKPIPYIEWKVAKKTFLFLYSDYISLTRQFFNDNHHFPIYTTHLACYIQYTLHRFYLYVEFSTIFYWIQQSTLPYGYICRRKKSPLLTIIYSFYLSLSVYVCFNWNCKIIIFTEIRVCVFSFVFVSSLVTLWIIRFLWPLLYCKYANVGKSRLCSFRIEFVVNSTNFVTPAIY